jgi:HK97 family phage major capsid protein
MAYNNVMSRTDVAALIPEQVSQAMMTSVTAQSAALSLFRRINLSTNQTRFPVLSALPVAYFVNGDTGLKQTTEVNWANKYINVEEIAAILPIAESVLDDINFNVWDNVRPALEGAIARALDNAIFFGVNKPASWPADIVASAVAAGNTVARGATQAQGGVAQDLNNVFAAVEGDGFVVDGVVSRTSMRSVLRGQRDTTGQALADLTGNEMWGVPIRWMMPGLWPAGALHVDFIAGDFSQGIIGIRQDLTYKILDQAVLTDGAGAIQYNLPQQDMIALRVVARYGWTVANPINYEGANDATQFPFAVLREAT